MAIAEPVAPDDDVAVSHSRLRSALELAVEVAAEARRRKLPVPSALTPFITAAAERLPAAALGKVRRSLAAAPELRAQIGSVAVEAGVDELGTTWLVRPEGWAERVLLLDRLATEHEQRERAEADARRERKRREAAESKRDAAQTEARREAELNARLRVDLAAATDAAVAADLTMADLRADVAADRTAARHAADRQAAAEQRRDEAEARLGDTPRPAPVLDAAALRRTVARLHEVSVELAGLVEPVPVVEAPPVRRTPISLPGAVLGRPAAAAEHLLRAGADVLVDGYNVAKLGWPALSLADQRARLLDLVDNVIRRCGAPVTVVFDGADVVGAVGADGRLAKVSFSPAGVTADDVIVDRVRGLPAGRHVVVVTDDGEVRRRTSRLGANLVHSQSLLDVGLR